MEFPEMRHFTENREFSRNFFILLQVNLTTFILEATNLKIDYNYMLWYSNVANVLVTGIIPICCLTVCNYRIYNEIKNNQIQIELLQMKEVKGVKNSPKFKDIQLSKALFAIVIFFMICHSLRIILNINEIVTFERTETIANNINCINSTWTLVGESISILLITLNSSTNFFIFCYMSTQFRVIFIGYVRRLLLFFRDPLVLYIIVLLLLLVLNYIFNVHAGIF